MNNYDHLCDEYCDVRGMLFQQYGYCIVLALISQIKSYQSRMGCVTSEATNDNRRHTNSLTSLRDSKGQPLNDGEAARRQDEKHIEKKLSKEI